MYISDTPFINSTVQFGIPRCPYCFKEDVAATFRGAYCNPEKKAVVDRSDVNKHVYSYAIFVSCNNCHNGLVKNTKFHGFWDISKQPIPKQNEINGFEWQPLPAKMQTPDHLPDNVKNYYLQGTQALSAGSPDAAGAMFRKAMETCLSYLVDEDTENLKSLIDKARAAGSIPESLKTWAHLVRIDGNDAVHNQFTIKEAQNTADLTYFLLTYMISIPAEIENRKPKI